MANLYSLNDLHQAAEWLTEETTEHFQEKDILAAGERGEIALYAPVPTGSHVYHFERDERGANAIIDRKIQEQFLPLSKNQAAQIAGYYPLTGYEIPIEYPSPDLDNFKSKIGEDSFFNAVAVTIRSHEVIRVREDDLRRHAATICSALINCLSDDALEQAAPSVKDGAQTDQKQIDIPGKLPRVSIGKCAVLAAWQIENETTERASAKKVMEQLRKWVSDGTYPDVLIKMDKGDVIWHTSKQKEKRYGNEACEKTLEAWIKSRH